MREPEVIAIYQDGQELLKGKRITLQEARRIALQTSLDTERRLQESYAIDARLFLGVIGRRKRKKIK